MKPVPAVPKYGINKTKVIYSFSSGLKSRAPCLSAGEGGGAEDNLLRKMKGSIMELHGDSAVSPCQPSPPQCLPKPVPSTSIPRALPGSCREPARPRKELARSRMEQSPPCPHCPAAVSFLSISGLFGLFGFLGFFFPCLLVSAGKSFLSILLSLAAP